MDRREVKRKNDREKKRIMVRRVREIGRRETERRTSETDTVFTSDCFPYRVSFKIIS